MPAVMGRPSLPDGESRSERIVTLLTKGERVVLAQQASAASLTLSAYAHQLIVQGLKNNYNLEVDK